MSPARSAPMAPASARSASPQSPEELELEILPSCTTATTAPLSDDETDAAGEQASRSAKSSSRPFRTFWRRNVALSVPHHACRDYFALERTFLGYLRTSSVLALAGVVVAQLAVLQQGNPKSSLSTAGKSLALCCYLLAIWAIFCGAYRAWRFQRALVRGKSLSGGFEINTLAILVILLFGALLGLVIWFDDSPDMED
ncbi:hypothetical protein GGR56DRAFT_649305 [Xylariaceae sp. FL0804]|nr:hypothetical protein GGR56DRAFT_649305 [Xylariaceae sp. FL0804]